MDSHIDLNADVGEGEPCDGELIALVSRCNIACGGHAGDAESMRAALQAARSASVAAGAHPSYPDREGFGRRAMEITLGDLERSLREQIRSLKTIAESEGVRLAHLKPHGALYHKAGSDPNVASLVIALTQELLPDAAIVGPPGSELSRAAASAGLVFLGEGFADRAYSEDGRLVPRSLEGAVLERDEDRVRQAVSLATSGMADSVSGRSVTLDVDTICLHGDSPGALESARHIRSALEAAGIRIGAPS